MGRVSGWEGGSVGTNCGDVLGGTQEQAVAGVDRDPLFETFRFLCPPPRPLSLHFDFRHQPASLVHSMP